MRGFDVDEAMMHQLRGHVQYTSTASRCQIKLAVCIPVSSTKPIPLSVPTAALEVVWPTKTGKSRSAVTSRSKTV